MSNFEPPPSQCTADTPPEKPLETEIPSLSIPRAISTSGSTVSVPEDRHAKIMENFKRMAIKFAIASSPIKYLSPLQKSFFEQRLHQLFPCFRTPNHPPYSAMIDAAIRKLDEKGASSEEAISILIRQDYPNLPWAHDTILKHHLENLCKIGTIVKTSNGLYMLGHVVTRHDSTTNPCSTIGAESNLSLSSGSDSDPTSSSWSSSSYCSSPRPMRKCQLHAMRRNKQGEKRESKIKRSNKEKVNHKSAKMPERRLGRPSKNDLLEDEIEVDDQHLMLEMKSEESESEDKSVEECEEGIEGMDRLRRRHRKIWKQDQGQETASVVQVRTYEHEDMGVEEGREPRKGDMKGQKAHLKRMHIPGRSRGRPCKEFSVLRKTQAYAGQMKIGSQSLMLEETEEPGAAYKIHKELAQVVEDHDQLQGSLQETLEWRREEDSHTVSKTGKSRSFGETNKLIEECNLVMEVKPQKDVDVEECDEKKEHENFTGIEEQGHLEEHNILSDQDQSSGQKRKGRPPKRSVKRRKVPLELTCLPGRVRGRPAKKDLCVEKAPPDEGQMETTDTQNPVIEEKTELPGQKHETNKGLTEVVEENNQSQGKTHETLAASPTEESEMVNEIGEF